MPSGQARSFAGVVAGRHATQTWWPFLLVWGMPLTVGYQTAAALRLCVEHLVAHPGDAAQSCCMARLTRAVVPG